MPSNIPENALTSENDLWEQGYLDNPVRNQFIIPEVARLFNSEIPGTVLDVGCGTGYMAREIDRRVKHSIHWTLLDTDAERIRFAEANRPSGFSGQILNDTLASVAKSEQEFSSILVSFTLLEIGATPENVDLLVGLCRPGGLIVVALPDVIVDVWKSFSKRGEPNFPDFIEQPVALAKVNAFTGTRYPFVAERLDSIILKFISGGMVLEHMIRRNFDEEGFFLLAFRRRSDV